MGYPTQNDLKEAIKNFTRQFYNKDVYGGEVESFLDLYSEGLADILWKFLYDSKVQTQIEVGPGIPVQTSGGSGVTTGKGYTITEGNIIPPTP